MIDLTMLGLIMLAGTTLRDRWEQSKRREEALLKQMIPNLPPPEIPPLQPASPSTPASYLEIAQQFLFARDRNPTVILDPPPPPPAPKPMPPLPLAYGVLDLGSGPTVILSERPGAPHHGFRPGQQVGEFKLLSVNRSEIVFEWDGKQIKRKLEDLIDKRPSQADSQTAQTPSATPAPQQTTSLAPVKAGPGVELSGTTRACVPNDTTPAGTVQDGFKKVTTKTPFGEQCRWEKVN